MLLMRTFNLILLLLFEDLFELGKNLDGFHYLNHLKDETGCSTNDCNDVEPIVSNLKNVDTLASGWMHTKSNSDLRMFGVEVSLRHVPLVARNLTIGVLRILNPNILESYLKFFNLINPFFDHGIILPIEDFVKVVFNTIT